MNLQMKTKSLKTIGITQNKLKTLQGNKGSNKAIKR